MQTTMTGKRERLDLSANGMVKYQPLPKNQYHPNGDKREWPAYLFGESQLYDRVEKLSSEELSQMSAEEKWQLECGLADESLRTRHKPDDPFPRTLVVANAKREATRRILPNEGHSECFGVKGHCIEWCRGKHAKRCYLERNERELCDKIRPEIPEWANATDLITAHLNGTEWASIPDPVCRLMVMQTLNFTSYYGGDCEKPKSGVAKIIDQYFQDTYGHLDGSTPEKPKIPSFTGGWTSKLDAFMKSEDLNSFPPMGLKTYYHVLAWITPKQYSRGGSKELAIFPIEAPVAKEPKFPSTLRGWASMFKGTGVSWEDLKEYKNMADHILKSIPDLSPAELVDAMMVELTAIRNQQSDPFLMLLAYYEGADPLAVIWNRYANEFKESGSSLRTPRTLLSKWLDDMTNLMIDAGVRIADAIVSLTTRRTSTPDAKTNYLYLTEKTLERMKKNRDELPLAASAALNDGPNMRPLYVTQIPWPINNAIDSASGVTFSAIFAIVTLIGLVAMFVFSSRILPARSQNKRTSRKLINEHPKNEGKNGLTFADAMIDAVNEEDKLATLGA
ncbi:uncharacterized protein PAC_06816 [Phialocephala subalpina]|uniref:Uncharacterized protein n=1 Tax=Phialocephala subalpina TaxID=576137 RepID=A0A1L7WVY9_9HELO|nr:uncharacterized protein PAC_06816 [Phialocephala subalpina]